MSNSVGTGTKNRRHPSAVRERGAGGRPAWVRTYIGVLALVDGAAALAASELARRFPLGQHLDAFVLAGVHVSYSVVAVLWVPLWLVALALGGAYDSREIGNGSEEYRRVANTSIRVLAVVALVSYSLHLELARGFVGLAIPSAFVLTLIGRFRVRKWVHRKRARGEFSNKVIVVGSRERAAELVRHLQRVPYAGFSVLGVCIPGDAETLEVNGVSIPVLGEPGRAQEAVFRVRADAVAVSDDASLPSGALRRLAWAIEGSGVDLIVVPALTDVAGPRIVTRPVAGLPLLHVEEPLLSGAARVFKEVFDRSLAVLAVVLLSPLMLATALAIKLTSRGRVFYRQTRVGKDGNHFTIMKFRTMRADADLEQDEVAHLNNHDGPLFKIRDDPRRTRVGRSLRRMSVDELPQIWHVITGKMSLVGPRPPLPSEVEQYDESTSRRLLVKPGLTGLWQVSGRSDLTWEESVRLDLYYVENWSPALDFLIMWKTVAAVVRGRGAY